MKKMNFAINLRELMMENKLSQQEIAVKIGVSQRAVSKWLRSETEPTATNLFNLALFFDVSADFLLGLEEH